MLADTAETSRIVIFIGGLQSHSLATADDHSLTEDFSPLRRRIVIANPAHQFVFFSYRAGARAQAGIDPLIAWRGGSYDDESEPVYRASETTDRPIADHVRGLDWLIRDLRGRYPAATFDLVGFSLGGIVSLSWAADADEELVASVHRIVLISSPVGGINPLCLLAPKAGIRHALQRYRVDFGRGRVFEDLRDSSPVMARLRRAIERVDVSSVENSRDYLVNGRRITGQVILPIWTRTIALGRGVAASGFLPASECYVADMGGWDRHLRVTHRQVMRGTSAEVQRAHRHIANLISTDGPRWRERQSIVPDVDQSTSGSPDVLLTVA